MSEAAFARIFGPDGEIEIFESVLQLHLQGTGDLATFQQMLLTQGGDVARTQNEQIDSFRTQLAAMQQQSDAALRRFGETLAEQLRLLSEASERRQASVGHSPPAS